MTNKKTIQEIAEEYIEQREKLYNMIQSLQNQIVKAQAEISYINGFLSAVEAIDKGEPNGN